MHNFLPFCDAGKFGAIKVKREDEFGPVKNANPADGGLGVDSPNSARALLLAQHNSWVQKQCPERKAAIADMDIEVDGLLSYEGEGQEFARQCKDLK